MQIEKLFYRAEVALWRIKAVLGRDGTAWPMTVEVSHHIDASEPDADGFCDYHYEYDVFEFTDGSVTFLARAYSDEPEKAAMMARIEGQDHHLLTKRDLRHPLFLEAAAYLRAGGKTDLDWLDRRSRAYVPLT
ncbi:hypothetical protein QA644_31345 (plasmid) [Rhizobium sp. CC1099]|uniref:hypothetical protein n=1 Tax=Rhizobium sp. CC1099 TaxID=3039160 RepID=UPI0024B110DC|nr:hypothetical protein [Rhizobium sp. CC1099]WFU90471.1 hypothetical protein QA644_31345 [Rhizobium sp. CC1099]